MIALITLCSAFADSLDAPAIVTHTTSPIEIDGRFTEAVWDSAIPITTFKRYMPTDGDAPPGNTEIRFVQDEDTLYIGVRVTDVDYPIQFLAGISHSAEDVMMMIKSVFISIRLAMVVLGTSFT